jgi:ATP-dependent RNA helicase DeaD
MQRIIEQFTGQRLTSMKVPSRADVAARRTALFKERLLKTMQDEDLDVYLALVEEIAEESGCDLAEIAAAAVRLARGDKPLEPPSAPEPEPIGFPLPAETETVMLYIDAGRNAGLRPADIVGAIANEANLPGKYIGPIEIFDNYALVGVPAQAQAQVLSAMADATVRGQAANIRPATSRGPESRDRSGRKAAAHDAGTHRSASHKAAPREAERREFSLREPAHRKPRYEKKGAPAKSKAPSKKKAFKHKKK